MAQSVSRRLFSHKFSSVSYPLLFTPDALQLFTESLRPRMRGGATSLPSFPRRRESRPVRLCLGNEPGFPRFTSSATLLLSPMDNPEPFVRALYALPSSSRRNPPSRQLWIARTSTIMVSLHVTPALRLATQAWLRRAPIAAAAKAVDCSRSRSSSQFSPAAQCWSPSQWPSLNIAY